MLLDVFELVRDLGPNFYAFLDAENTARSDAEVFAEAMVDVARNADEEWTRTLIAYTFGLVNTLAKPCEMLHLVVRQVLGTQDMAVVQAHRELQAVDVGKLCLERIAKREGNLHCAFDGRGKVVLARIDNQEGVGREAVDKSPVLLGYGRYYFMVHGVYLSYLSSAMFFKQIIPVLDLKVDDRGLHVNAGTVEVEFGGAVDVTGLNILELGF